MQYAPAPLPAELAAHYRRSGYVSDVTLSSLLSRNASEFGSLTAVIDGDVAVTWAELADAAARFAGFLRAQGVGPGDVVVWQLPNWWETVVVAYGIWAVGAISSPVVTIYRELELRNVVKAVQPKCVVVPRSFRNTDHVEMMTEACRSVDVIPDIRVVVRGDSPGWTSFDAALGAQGVVVHDVDVDAPALVGWTSGTTSGAKGVVASTRTFVASSIRSARNAGIRWSDRAYMPAPISHATGLLAVVAIPIFTGSSVVLRDGWDADRAIDDITANGVTFTSGAAVFMTELLAAMKARGIDRLPLASGYPCGGSTIPVLLAEAADDAGLQPGRSWGMTECPVVTATNRFHPRELRCATDGVLAPGSELRLLDSDGRDVGVGRPGEALVRGPQRALGYLDPAHTKDGFDEDGWFRTGDVGILDERGAFTVTGRVKEIINRGGEKLSSREIEDALIGHPAVREAAVVPAPHPRLGEQPAAYVLVAQGTPTPTTEELAGFLRASGMAPQKIPQVWRFVGDLPRTPSGKVKKYELTDQLNVELATG